MNPLTQAALLKLVMFFAAIPAADFPKFPEFLDKIPAEIKVAEVATTIETYKSAPEKLSDDQWNIMFRLLGVYARTRYQDEMVESLRSLVKIDTSKKGDQPQKDNPEIFKIRDQIAKLAKDFDLEFHNYDNFMFQVSLEANRPLATPPVFGLLTHSDVVTVNAGDWLGAKQGKTPFDERILPISKIPGAPSSPDVQVLLGRGTEDDKCSIISAMYAMRVAKETKMPLRRSIRLLIETTEESGGEGIAHLLTKHKDQVPQYNVVLDANYPVVSAESGVANLIAQFEVQKATGEGAEVTSVLGASAPNQIAQTAYFALKYPAGSDPKQSLADLQKRAAAFAASIKTTRARSLMATREITFAVSAWKKDQLKVTVTGVSAHSSEPASGLDPVPPALLFIDALNQSPAFALKENHFTRAAKYVADMFGLGFKGEKFGVAYQDFASQQGFEKCLPDMGPLFMTVSQAGIPGDTQLLPKNGRPADGKFVEVVCNIRNPRGNLPPTASPEESANPERWAKSANTLIDAIEARLKAYDPQLQFAWSCDYRNSLKWLWVDSGAPWINTLLDLFNGVYNDPGKPPIPSVATAGTTTAKKLPKAVSFGPSLGSVAKPEQKYRGHTVNEFKRLENFYLDVQLYAEMVLRISNLESLE